MREAALVPNLPERDKRRERLTRAPNAPVMEHRENTWGSDARWRGTREDRWVPDAPERGGRGDTL
eukprot:1845338-Pyramimonas_sp.AAC.1